ncbi:MAG: dihydropteroate synthase [Oligoflexus sp.]
MEKDDWRRSPAQIMGVVNITPDSFSDGGRFHQPQKALEQILRLVDDGADIVDIGAESSRPGARLIPAEEEWQRLEPVLERLSTRQIGAKLSVDTNKPEIMRRVIPYGVDIINDIKGGADDDSLKNLAENHLTYIAMHMHRTPEDMQQAPLDGDEAIAAVDAFFAQTRSRLMLAGFPESAVWLDPGIGFGKTDRANLRLLKYSLKISDQYHVVVGISRKSLIGRLLGIDSPVERDGPSKMLELGLLLGGIRMIRTHDVKSLNHMRSLLS